MVTFLAIIGIVFFLIVVIGIGAIINGFVLSILWNWFMIPLFNLPELTILSAIGLGIVVSWLTSHVVDIKKKENEELKTFWILFFLKPVLILLMGYIIHCLMR